jgi:hypothetical protein
LPLFFGLADSKKTSDSEKRGNSKIKGRYLERNKLFQRKNPKKLKFLRLSTKTIIAA